MKPEAGENVTLKFVNFLVVEYPITFRMKPLVVALAIWIVSSVGAAEGIVSWTVGGEAGVKSTTPACVAKEGVSVMVSATVPVCKNA